MFSSVFIHSIIQGKLVDFVTVKALLSYSSFRTDSYFDISYKMAKRGKVKTLGLANQLQWVKLSPQDRNRHIEKLF